MFSKRIALPYVLDQLGHVQRYEKASAQIVLVKQGRNDPDPVRADELLHQADQLGDEVLSVARPGRLHLIKNVARRFEDDLLRPVLTCQVLQVNPA